jgi:hypothetical protein
VGLGSAADSYVSAGLELNNGGATIMYVGGDAAFVSRSFVRFNVSSIPAGSSVTAAQLTLCMLTNPDPGTTGRAQKLSRVTSAWSETGVTWSTQPSVAASATASVGVPPSAQCITLTVTADVQAWVDGAANYGWRFGAANESQTGVSDVGYATREYSVAGKRPLLTVAYTTP